MDILEGMGRTADTFALFLDMDGTLIEFAPTPGEVIVPSDLVQALAVGVERMGGALALLSGRPIAELDRLTAPLCLPASGLHGGEIRPGPSAPVRVIPHKGLPAWLRPALRRTLTEFPGVFLEDKGLSVAVHFRQHPQLGVMLGHTLRQCIAVADGAGIDLVAGDMVYELKPAGINKGRALRQFMALPRFIGRRPIFVSDHPVDQAGFDAASRLGGIGVSIGRRMPGVLCSLPDPRAVRAWLLELAA